MQTIYSIAAKRLRIKPEHYAARRLAGESWCYRCRTWQRDDAFPCDRCRPSGRAGTCRECRRLLDAGRRRESVT